MPELQGPQEGGDGAAGPCWEAEGQVMTPPPRAPKEPQEDGGNNGSAGGTGHHAALLPEGRHSTCLLP